MSAHDDPEKAAVANQVSAPDSSSGDDMAPGAAPAYHSSSPGWLGHLEKWNSAIEGLAGFEARGIARVLPSERDAPSLAADVQVALLWFSANVSVNNLAVGLFGPLVFGLGFTDSALCAVFGGLLGSLSTAYMSIWGPRSGHRTMIVARYFMGYWPAKIPCLLNIVLMVGYCTIDCIIGGQMLSAVSGGGMSIAVGIVIVSLVSWVVAVFGMGMFHHYERFVYSTTYPLSIVSASLFRG
jgi:purine-cytosine permease-like protein